MARARSLKDNPLDPDVAVLAKLASIVVHIDEALGSGGHAFDLSAVKALIGERDVQEWVAAMESLALVPKKRS